MNLGVKVEPTQIETQGLSARRMARLEEHLPGENPHDPGLDTPDLLQAKTLIAELE
jgi:hypothetical protein